jgi:hypothetical protein
MKEEKKFQKESGEERVFVVRRTGGPLDPWQDLFNIDWTHDLCDLCKDQTTLE